MSSRLTIYQIVDNITKKDGFLTQILFRYFAEDTCTFPHYSFTGANENYTQTDGCDLAVELCYRTKPFTTDECESQKKIHGMNEEPATSHFDDITLFETEDGQTRVEVRFQNENV